MEERVLSLRDACLMWIPLRGAPSGSTPLSQKEMKAMQQRRYRSPCLWTILWALWTILSGLVPVGAQSPSYRVAALIPGPTYYPVLQGLQEGLAGWGYHVGTNLTLLVY